jgi:phage gpG-like protein
MAGAALEMSLEDFPAFLEAKANGLSRLSLREPLTAAKVLLVADVRENFDQGHDPDGVAWLPLKNPSQKRGGASSKPLRSTDLLMASVTAQGKGHIEKLTDTELVLGTNLEYAGVHQFGATIFFPEKRRSRPWVFMSGGRKVFTRRVRAHQVVIPPRPFLGFSERAVDRLERIFAEWFAGQTL